MLAERRTSAYEALIPLTPARLGRRRRSDVLTGVVDDLTDVVDAQVRVTVPGHLDGRRRGPSPSRSRMLLSPPVGLVMLGLGVAVCLISTLAARLESRSLPELLAARAEVTRVSELMAQPGGRAARRRRLGHGARLARRGPRRARPGHPAHQCRSRGRSLALPRRRRRGRRRHGRHRPGPRRLDPRQGAARARPRSRCPRPSRRSSTPCAPSPGPGAASTASTPCSTSPRPSPTRRPPTQRPSPMPLPRDDPGHADDPRRAPGPGTRHTPAVTCGTRALTASWTGDRTDLAPDRPRRARPAAASRSPGPNGSGKSTLLAVLARHLDPSGGTYRARRRPTCSTEPLEETRARIAVVDDETHVFATTLRNNLTLARPDADDAEVERALARRRPHGPARGSARRPRHDPRVQRPRALRRRAGPARHRPGPRQRAPRRAARRAGRPPRPAHGPRRRRGPDTARQRTGYDRGGGHERARADDHHGDPPRRRRRPVRPCPRGAPPPSGTMSATTAGGTDLHDSTDHTDDRTNGADPRRR